MAQAVRRRPLIAEARVIHQSNEWRFSQGQSGVWSGFLLVFSLLPSFFFHGVTAPRGPWSLH